jgi:FdhD protein
VNRDLDSTLPWDVLLYEDEQATAIEDRVVVEEPLEIALRRPGAAARPTFTTLRTPGMDRELALGWLLSEGVIASPAAVRWIEAVADPDRPQHQRIEVELAEALDLSPLERLSWSSSACGTCGRTAIATAIDNGRCPAIGGALVPTSTLYGLVATLGERQRVFAATGGLHAAALFSCDGRLIAAAEDVGRHNAVDKVIGLTANTEPSRQLLLVSGRIGYEIAAKAVRRGYPLLAAVGAPSSLAIRVAAAGGLTLAGFLRDRRVNVYTHPQRIEP